MTTNQVAYWNLQEQSRANKARETETKRHNQITEGTEIANTVFSGLKSVGDFAGTIVDAAGSIVTPMGKIGF